MASDPFTNVLGAKRGKQAVDTVLSSRPSDAAKEDLETYLTELKELNFTRTLTLLQKEHAQIPHLPLLGQLASEFSLHLVRKSAVLFDDAVRHFLDATSVYSKFSDYLVVVSEQKRVPGQAAGRHTLHVWPQGDQVGPIGCLENNSATVCGLEINRNAWRRAERGTWSSDELARQGWGTCPQCERDCPDNLKYILTESTRYIPFGSELYSRLLRTITERTVKRIAEGSFSDTDDASRLAHNTYRRMLLPAAVTYAKNSGEPAIQRLLDAREWRSMAREYGQPLAPLLTADDWKEALLPCLPQQDGEDITEVPEEAFQAAKDQLKAALHSKVPDVLHQ